MKRKEKISLYIAGLILSGLIFLPSENQQKSLAETQQTQTDDDYDNIFCKDDQEDAEEIASLLKNEVIEVDCLFGGCNSYF